MRPPSESEAAIEMLRAAGDGLVALTGAGVSTESGVPDYRSPGSPWRVNTPIPFAEFLRDPAARIEAWRRKFAMDDIYRDARPNRGHRALAALAAAGRIDTLITQNIDGLHQSGGFPPAQLIELHGNGTYAVCLDCGRKHELAAVRALFEQTHEAPRCLDCGGVVKSATISFGQSIDPSLVQAAVAAARRCTAFLVVGSTLLVKPAATLPLLAQAAGAPLVIVNREPTVLDARADHAIRNDAGDFLEALAHGH